MVSNSAHADWNISMQKDEVKKINELQKTTPLPTKQP